HFSSDLPQHQHQHAGSAKLPRFLSGQQRHTRACRSLLVGLLAGSCMELDVGAGLLGRLFAVLHFLLFSGTGLLMRLLLALWLGPFAAQSGGLLVCLLAGLCMRMGLDVGAASLLGRLDTAASGRELLGRLFAGLHFGLLLGCTGLLGGLSAGL